MSAAQEFMNECVDMSIEIIDLKQANRELLEALRHYANVDNWQDDSRGIPRTWLEPDSSTRNQYEGYCIARAAINKAEGAPT